MKKLGVMAVLIALTGITANAVIVTDPPLALRLQLDIDASGFAVISNLTGAPVDIDAYEIWSTGGNLNPVGWVSLADSVSTRPVPLMTALGTGALSFGELTATPALLAEGSLSAAATWQVGGAWDIGNPVNPGTPLEDLMFYYSLKPVSEGGDGTPGDKYLGVIVPEPATMVLLAIGGMGLLARRRR